ncbi:MAG: hypothetical protein A2W22_02585 [Candidatus Levybacteria bacterium RBG_16_35_11]|nr:MAG: hypothetical protein A2W22_02585 [Candidatus Levybacteria bacterium RBG_16_35_11]
MLKVVTDIEEIKKIQRKFEEILIKYSNLEIEANLKGPGFRKLSTLYWSRNHGIYFRIGKHYKTKSEKFWNVFGISQDELDRGGDYRITVQVNFPYVQKKRGKLAGRIAIDENNDIFILHDGSINVSNHPVNFLKFSSAYKGRIIEPEEINDDRKYALVCKVSDNEITMNMISDFVRAVHSAKDIIRDELTRK